MTHSQYLLPALPDLLKSHRLSYKKFLHNGIDEEFDLLSAKTELNEEELFYEGLKLNHVDELSPSQVESLDYIYHPEEKIFLIPKRTLEDSLRGRQSHSFHLFVPLEVKMLPFQDELDQTTAHLPTEAKNLKGPIGYRPQTESRSPEKVFFRGGSGQPLSETRKEFFKAALNFFFQQPKIQEILLTKRFLLLRWFCEKIQYLEPSIVFPKTTNAGKKAGFAGFSNCATEPNRTFRSVVFRQLDSQLPGQLPNSFAAIDRNFDRFDEETKTKLFQIYQSILRKLELRTQKKKEPLRVLPVALSGAKRGEQKPTALVQKSTQLVFSAAINKVDPSILKFRKGVKRFVKSQRWSGLVSELKSLSNFITSFEEKNADWRPENGLLQNPEGSSRLTDLASRTTVLSSLLGPSAVYPEFPIIPSFFPTEFPAMSSEALENPDSKSKQGRQLNGPVVGKRGKIQTNRQASKKSLAPRAVGKASVSKRGRSGSVLPRTRGMLKSSQRSSRVNQAAGSKGAMSQQEQQVKNAASLPKEQGTKFSRIGANGVSSQKNKKSAGKTPLKSPSKKFPGKKVARQKPILSAKLAKDKPDFLDQEPDFFENSELFLEDDPNLDNFGPDLVKAFNRRNAKKNKAELFAEFEAGMKNDSFSWNQSFDSIFGAEQRASFIGSSNEVDNQMNNLKKGSRGSKNPPALREQGRDQETVDQANQSPEQKVAQEFLEASLEVKDFKRFDDPFKFLNSRPAAKHRTLGVKGLAGYNSTIFNSRQKWVARHLKARGSQRRSMAPVGSTLNPVEPTSLALKIKSSHNNRRSQLRSGKAPKTPKGFAAKRSKPHQKEEATSLAQLAAETMTSANEVGKVITKLGKKAVSKQPLKLELEISQKMSSGFFELFQGAKKVDLPGFHLSGAGSTQCKAANEVGWLRAGRTPDKRRLAAGKAGYRLLDGPDQSNPTGLEPESRLRLLSSTFSRFGQLELGNSILKSRQSIKSAPKRLVFLRRILKTLKMRNKQKKKLKEIFFTIFPSIPENKGLRFWKLKTNWSRNELAAHKKSSEGASPPSAAAASEIGYQLGSCLPRFFQHFKKVSQESGLRSVGKPRFLDPTLLVEYGPAKFLSLPQNALGSLWKVLPTKQEQSVKRRSTKVTPQVQPSFQRYQLQKLAYRKRNMFLATNFVGSNLEKKVALDRFVLKSRERRALHSKNTFSLRERAAWKIEKKSHTLAVLPGLEFWETAHSDKKLEEDWETVLQCQKQKLPSKLLVSVPTGDVIFLKSEKDSYPKQFIRRPTWKFMNWLSQSALQTVANGPAKPGAPAQLAPLGSEGYAGKPETGPPVGRVLLASIEQISLAEKLWMVELVNMKFFMKKILTYSPAALKFFWKYRLSYLWESLSESSPEANKGGDGSATKPASPPPSSARIGLLAQERKNLPKVCSDLRKLLAPVHELLFREVNDPQKFFVSGQVSQKEWPVQKDGSKSYFALLNLGKMPFMTKQGNFLINGSPRVLVSQVAKCPNFYTKMKIDSRGRPRYWTEFVSSFKNAGEWIQFHIDLENKMFFSLGNKKKYSIFIFLGALGISPPEIPDVIEHWDFLKQSIHKEELVVDKNLVTFLVEPLEVREARLLFHDCQNYTFYPGVEKSDEELQKFFEDMFYNPARYFLGHAGREALNQRRRFSGTPSRSRALEKEDFLAAINALIEVRLGLAPPDDIDHLKYRRVRLPGELLQNEFHLALDEIFTLDLNKFREGPLPGDALEEHPNDQRRTIFPSLQALEQKIFEKGRPFSISRTVGIQSTYQVSPLEKRMKNFFHTGQLSQYMDQTNPLAEITHKRRLTSLGPDGLPKQVGVAVRELHPSHFGRICPIETPEGLNAGLVASLSSQARIGSQHTLLAPYYWVKDRTREFPQKIFNNEIPQSADNPIANPVGYPTEPAGLPALPAAVNEVDLPPVNLGSFILKYPPVLPEIIFLSAAAEDSVYICSEDYWFSSKYKNFETIPNTETEGPIGSSTLFSDQLTPTGSLAAFGQVETNRLAGSVGDLRGANELRSRQPLDLSRLASSSSEGSTLAQQPTKLTELVGRTNSTGEGKNGFSLSNEVDWIRVDSKNSLVKFQTVFPARYQQEFFTVTKSQIDFFSICPTQMISVGTSLIPFLEHDDANRALMGSNMQRQALPLLVLERPIVGTGSEKGVAQSSNAVLLSEFAGQVSFVDGRKIVVDSFPKTITSFPENSQPKISRLLMGYQEHPKTELPGDMLLSQESSAAAKLPAVPAHELEDIFSFGRRHLFQNFQNRTEDGKVKTIRRIFTVKIKIHRDESTFSPRRQLGPKGSAAHEIGFSARVGKKRSSSMRRQVPNRTRAGKPASSGGSNRLPLAAGTGPVIVKIFPISEEEYEKSRTLLRREFIQKYKEIQKKKVFPRDFFPGERWKRTGKIWENHSRQLPGNLTDSGANRTFRSVDWTNEVDSTWKRKYLSRRSEANSGLPVGTSEADSSKKVGLPKKLRSRALSLSSSLAVELTSNSRQGWPGTRRVRLASGLLTAQESRKLGSFFNSEEVKRIRYKKPNLIPNLELNVLRFAARIRRLQAQKKRMRKLLTMKLPQAREARQAVVRKPTKLASPGSTKATGPSSEPYGSLVQLAPPMKLAKPKGKQPAKRAISQQQSAETAHSVLFHKKTLRRSSLPIKRGRIFFDPTPQMIFKNILSRNSKKREILRKALMNHSFVKKSLSRSGQPTGPASTANGAAASASGVQVTALPAGSSPETGKVSGSGRFVDSSSSLRSRPGLDVIRLAGYLPPHQKVSWSVSMKKVTPYTQVTYNVHRYWRTNQNTLRRQRPAVRAGDWVAAGDLLADSSATLRGELCVGQNILVGYVPWEGYNFEDAIVVNERLVEEDIYTSILIDRYEMEASIDDGEKITRKIPDLKPHILKNLDSRGIIYVGTWVEEDDILVGKILPVTTELQGYSKLLADIYQIPPPVAKDVSFRVPDRISGRVLECSVSEMVVRTSENKAFSTPWKVTLYLVEKRRMKLGDKMSGRHGNKGIVSIILPPQDMPFLPDGTPLDVALNPLGVPSRMNVGQLLESLLGLAGHHLHQKFRIPAFDEMYGEDFSRRIVYDKLLEASQKTQKPWLFNPNFPGKMMLRDGRTGDYFHQPVLVGYPYMLKLIHMVDDKMHARATGPYTMVTQQPLKGRANRGGQRLGEMEVWAVEAFAATYALQELLTLKSDDITGRNHFLLNFLKRKKLTVGGIPDAFRVLMHELQSLCFHVHYTEDYRLTYPTLLESSNIPETPVPENYGRK